jgi:hypothetical protein
MRTLLLAGGNLGGPRASTVRGRSMAWLVTVLEVSLILALLLTGD